MKVNVFRKIAGAMCFLSAVAVIVLVVITIPYVNATYLRQENGGEVLAFVFVLVLFIIFFGFGFGVTAIVQTVFGFLYMLLKVKSRKFFIVGLAFIFVEVLQIILIVLSAIFVGGGTNDFGYPLICLAVALPIIASIVFKSLCLAAYKKQEGEGVEITFGDGKTDKEQTEEN